MNLQDDFDAHNHVDFEPSLGPAEEQAHVLLAEPPDQWSDDYLADLRTEHGRLGDRLRVLDEGAWPSRRIPQETLRDLEEAHRIIDLRCRLHRRMVQFRRLVQGAAS